MCDDSEDYELEIIEQCSVCEDFERRCTDVQEMCSGWNSPDG